AGWPSGERGVSVGCIGARSRRSSLATALWGSMVLPPGPVYPPTRPSILTVGRETSLSSASCQPTSCTQCSTPSCFLVMSSEMRLAARAIIALSDGETGCALSADPSMAGSLPSADTKVDSACTRCQAGLSTRALLLE